jgi:hypothetical protein
MNIQAKLLPQADPPVVPFQRRSPVAVVKGR